MNLHQQSQRNKCWLLVKVTEYSFVKSDNKKSLENGKTIIRKIDMDIYLQNILCIKACAKDLLSCFIYLHFFLKTVACNKYLFDDFFLQIKKLFSSAFQAFKIPCVKLFYLCQIYNALYL